MRNEPSASLDTSQVQETDAAIKRNLLQDKTLLSSYQRTKKSSPDKRLSSTVIGAIMGIAVLSGSFVLLLGVDMIRVVKYLCDRLSCRLSEVDKMRARSS